MSVDVCRLASLAEAATPGPWGWDALGTVFAGVPGDDAEEVAALCFEENAHFIAAANPAVVLALVGRQRLLEAVAEAADALVDAPFGQLNQRRFYELREALAALDVDPPPAPLETDSGGD